jgi:hypothetical protein
MYVSRIVIVKLRLAATEFFSGRHWELGANGKPSEGVKGAVALANE